MSERPNPADEASESHPPTPEEAALQIGPEPSRFRRRRTLLVGVIIALAIIVIALWYFAPWSASVSTDDAFIAAHVVRISPRIPGRVLAVHVNDNQHVQTGELLVEIDPRDLQAALDQARAALGLAQAQHRSSISSRELVRVTATATLVQAQAELNSSLADAEQARAQYSAAAADAELARLELMRYEEVKGPAVSQLQLDQARAARERTRAQQEAARTSMAAAVAHVQAAQGRLAVAVAAPYQIAVAQADVQRTAAAVAQAEANVASAELQLSYTRLLAPAAGKITNKGVEPGDFLVQGQALAALVTDELWVVANFKETQITNIRPGQRARIRIDAYPSHLFDGRVESIQAGSGAYFSLLPPENATGNYVKVVQRVPVKIIFDELPDAEQFPMGPGMSVVPRVWTR